MVFTDRGSRALKGIPDEWQLNAVTGPPPSDAGLGVT